MKNSTKEERVGLIETIHETGHLCVRLLVESTKGMSLIQTGAVCDFVLVVERASDSSRGVPASIDDRSRIGQAHRVLPSAPTFRSGWTACPGRDGHRMLLPRGTGGVDPRSLALACIIHDASAASVDTRL